MAKSVSAQGHQPNRGHVLLVSPLTFSYHEAICASLQELGYSVTWWNERASNATWYKLALRLLPRTTRRWSAQHFKRLLQELPKNTITHVLVIKGEGLNRDVCQRMRDTLGDVPMGFYLWDGVDNVKGVVDIVDCFDCAASFDPVDAAKFGWLHRPLFSRFQAVVQPPVAGNDFDWCFIGTLHSDRHRVVHRLRQACGPDSRSFVLGFSPSQLMLWVRRFTDWTLWQAPAGSLSTKAMPAAAVNAIVARSSVVLDVEHPRQRGLTMRTIETLMAGHKLATTNQLIANTDLYDPSRVQIISRQEPAIERKFLTQSFAPFSPTLRHRYSCAGWAQDLIEQAETARAAQRDLSQQSLSSTSKQII
jgi:hypothetical protein